MFLPLAQGISVEVVRKGMELQVSLNNLTTHRDDWLNLQVELPGLTLTGAYLEAARRNGGDPFSTELPEIEGLEVGLAALPRLKSLALSVIPEEEQGYYRRLIMEGFIAVLQSECFFIEERGFESLAQYDSFWMDFYRDQCRYYSNLDRVQKDFSEHLEDHRRKHFLFSRQKHAHLEEKAGGTWRAVSSVRDSFHEMHLACEVQPDSLEVVEAWGKVNRAPDLVCWETEGLIPDLKGITLTDEDRKKARKIVGGPEGCSHFGDLVVDLIFLLKEHREHFTPRRNY